MNTTTNTIGIRTETILLRSLAETDAESLFKLRSNESVNEYLDRPVHTAIKQTSDFIQQILDAAKEGKTVYWVMALPEQSDLIGTFSIFNISTDSQSAEIGYELLPDYQGKGYMLEAFLAVIEYSFNTLNLKELRAEVDPANLKSVKLLDRNGFELETQLKDHEFFGGPLKDTVTYFLRR